MKNKEIEVKFLINKEVKDNLIKDLNKIAIKTKESHLIDTYYVPYWREFDVNGETQECVRIREDKKGIVLCYKKIHKECSPVYCDEYETRIEDKSQTEKILFALGFEIEMIIDKTRTSYKYKDFEFDFDSVKDLGELLEVELDAEDGNIEDIYTFVSKYGITDKSICNTGIQTLMKQKVKNTK